MLKFITSRLQVKLTLAFIAVMLIPTIIITLYTLNAGTNNLITLAQDSELNSLKQKADHIETTLGDYRADVVFLSQSPTTVDYANTLRLFPTSLQSRVTQHFFESFLQNTAGVYKDIRILDSHGQELIRVDDTNGTPTIVSGADLENKADRPYFSETIQMKVGQVYTSGLDLNVTRGQIDVPYLPVIRYATPLIASDGTKVGVIVLKAFGKNLADLLKFDDASESALLINSDGSYFIGPDQSKLYGSILKRDASFTKDAPNDSKLIATQAEGNLFESQDQPGLLQSFVHVHPEGQDQIQWTLVNQRSINDLLVQLSNARLIIFLIVSVAVLVAVGVAILFSRTIVRPLIQLSEAMEGISRGQWDTPLPKVTSQDEIGQVTTTFTKMTTDLNTAYTTLRQRSRDLEVANAVAREANRLKSDFLSTMSHELRTPLNAILGFTDLLLTGKPGPLNETQKTFLTRTAGNNRRLLKLINDILDLSRIEAGRMEIQAAPFSPKDMLDHVAAQASSLFSQKNLQFEMEIDPALPKTVVGDQNRLEQIVVNLLSNAAKFTSEGEVVLRAKPINQEQWTISVRDTGMGIAPHMQEMIFEPFRQIDGSTARQHGGTGLGLAIARELCQMMDCHLQVQSEINKGSTFTITLSVGTIVPEPTIEYLLKPENA
ncbi:MAG: ATP-binding protein [Chloroflexota bacterium]